MAKNDKDYAVVVGIKTYPAFDPDGPRWKGRKMTPAQYTTG